MSSIRAVVVDPSSEGRLALHEVEAPVPADSEALIRVSAISLNMGEVRGTTTAQAGWRPGWDLAGIVERQAADGSGPRTGSRVVGLVGSGAWAELVAVPTHILAEIPDTVTFEQAATLPVAGLTALRALEKGGFLLNRTVLVTGASGGVGHFACQLARQAGAQVVGVARRPERAALVQEAGAQHVVVGEDVTQAREFGPYHLILDSVGGHSLASTVPMLAPGGVCVNFGASDAHEVNLDLQRFFSIGGASLYGLVLFNELARRPGAEDLKNLARMIADGRLKPQISVEAPWTEIATVVQRMLKRQVTGKAVLWIYR